MPERRAAYGSCANPGVLPAIDGSGRVVSVHLTYGNRPETPPWPHYTVFADLEGWAAEEMAANHND